jgi:hypothetical protein
MATTFPGGDPEALYARALSEQSDLYAVYPGPNDIKHFGHVILYFVETNVDEEPIQGLIDVHNLHLSAFDPQQPELFSWHKLGELYQSVRAAKIAEHERSTDEFEALSGLSDRKKAA